MNQRTWPRYASVASVVVLCIAASALVGWWTDIALLKSGAPGLVTMKVNTACSLVCAAIALQLLAARANPSPLRARLGQAFALIPLSFGTLTLFEHLTGFDLGIDFLLQQWTAGSGPASPARMSLASASCLVGTGAALVSLRYPRLLMLVRSFAAYVLGVSLLAGIGYTFRIALLYGPGHFQPMALHTTVSCVLMSSALLLSPQSIGSRRLRDWPVQTKMVLLLLCASLAPFLLFSLLEVRSVALQLLETQGALLAARADQLADELDDFELDRRHSAAQLAIAAAAIGCCSNLSGSAAAQLEKLLHGLQANVSDVMATALFDAQGKPLQHAGADLPSAHDQPALRAALLGEAHTSELYVERFGAVEEPVLLYAAPVHAATGVQGVAVLWVRAAAVWRILNGRNDLAGRGSFAVLYDALGIRLAHTHNQQLVFRPAGRLRPWELSNAIQTQRFGARTRTLLENVHPFPEQYERALAKTPEGGMFRGLSPAVGAHAYSVGRRLKTLPWTLFYAIPESSLHDGLLPHSRNSSWFAVLLGVLSLLLGAAAASAILRPLRRLSDATARVGSGRPSEQLQVDSRDELGLLAERFNLMMKRTETQASELRRINEELEQRVVQRTAELTQSEQDLAITLNSIGDAVIATDRHGHVERMNPLAEKLTGWSIADARGTPLDSVFAISDEETGTRSPSPVARVIRDGVVVNLPNPTVLVSREGTTYPISDSAAPIFTREGQLRGVVLVFRDVREERRAQQALQASEALYRELYENHPDLCATIDLDTECILECNETLAVQLGYTKEEVVGKPVRELYAPEATLASEADRAIFQRTETLRDHERTLVRKDGSQLETSLSLTGRHDSRGVLGAKAVWRDISLRKQVERDQQFLFSLSELQSLATDANDLIVQVCAKLAEYLGAARGCFVEFDDAGDVFHVRRDFFRPGMHSMEGTFSLLAFGELMRNEQRAGKITAVADARIDPRTAAMYAAWEPFELKSSLSVPLIRQGRWVVSLIIGHVSTHTWLDREIALSRAVAERAWMWIEHARLRTELHERETRELARRNDERFHALVNNVTDYAIYLLDATGHITSWNRGAEQINGYSEAEVLGKHFSLFLTEEDLARGHADDALHRAATEGHFEEEAWRKRKDATRFWANVVLTPLYDADGKVEAFAKVTRDHTERRRTEEALRQRQSQLAASLREREVLLQEVHHRVKNNLQVISSLLSMQMRQVHEDNTRGALEESRRRVEAIALIHEKLYQSVDYSKVQFSEYVSTLAANVFAAAGTSPSNIKLKLLVEPVSLAVDKAIPCGLVLNELISNTLKHGFPGHRKGTVKVELRKLEQGKVLLLVADDGVGIPADLDLENSGSLGMQLVTTLVEQVRGELEVVRTPGTTFRIQVPVEVQP